MANPIYNTPPIASQNPILNSPVVQQLKKQYGDIPPRDIAMQLAKQRGIDPAQVESLAKRLGITN